jgi:hypothetical protein
VVAPLGRDDIGVPKYVLGQVVLVHHLGEIGLQLVLLGEEVRPIVVGLEAVAIEMVCDVDAGAGIAVLPPRSPGSGVLLHDGEGYVGLFEADPGQDAGFAASDDEDRHLGGGLDRQGRRTAGIGAVEIHLLQDEGQVVVAHVLAGHPVHHFPNESGAQRLWPRATAVSILCDHR